MSKNDSKKTQKLRRARATGILDELLDRLTTQREAIRRQCKSIDIGLISHRLHISLCEHLRGMGMSAEADRLFAEASELLNLVSRVKLAASARDPNAGLNDPGEFREVIGQCFGWPETTMDEKNYEKVHITQRTAIVILAENLIDYLRDLRAIVAATAATNDYQNTVSGNSRKIAENIAERVAAKFKSVALKKNRGRPRRNEERLTRDKRIVDAWATGNYRSFKELAKELGAGYTYSDIKLAVDNDRKARK